MLKLVLDVMGVICMGIRFFITNRAKNRKQHIKYLDLTILVLKIVSVLHRVIYFENKTKYKTVLFFYYKNIGGII